MGMRAASSFGGNGCCWCCCASADGSVCISPDSSARMVFGTVAVSAGKVASAESTQDFRVSRSAVGDRPSEEEEDEEEGCTTATGRAEELEDEEAAHPQADSD